MGQSGLGLMFLRGMGVPQVQGRDAFIIKFLSYYLCYYLIINYY